MPCTVIVGTQFGDEGKGKIVDYYSADADIIVRYNGGANAGHTVVADNEKFAFRLLPSGVLHRDKTVVIGNGVVLDPDVFLSEIHSLQQRDVTPAQIVISDRAHVVLPYHKLMDAAQEKFKGRLSAGTTRRGIGPCYSDKVARFGIRICDLLDKRSLSEKLHMFVPLQQQLLAVYGEDAELSLENLITTCLENGEKLSPYVTDTAAFLNRAIRAGKNVLLEGAQGTHLDIDWGVYPFGTSSNVTSGGACTGSGVPPTQISSVIGVVKAYTSRVGEGPFPTELNDNSGQHLREIGNEYGTVTGRPRRCGWLDLVMVDYAIRINGVSSIALTKIDVLSGLEKINICIAYNFNGKELQNFPANMRVLAECTPKYVTVDGWDHYSKRDWMTFLERGYQSLPVKTRQYIEFVENRLKTPVNLVSMGPEREFTMVRAN
ncbi:MAG: adenylosuccinate synthase [Candidatus Bathyarchaeota archaeon]|nr:MAG: adenylosuccinate synthase [Candidatus Bathyarchaeota archaeon]